VNRADEALRVTLPSAGRWENEEGYIYISDAQVEGFSQLVFFKPI